MDLKPLRLLYGIGLPVRLVKGLREAELSPRRYLGWLWKRFDFNRPTGRIDAISGLIIFILYLCIAIQLAAGVYFIVEWTKFGTAGYWQYGVALLISYPLVWAHVLALAAVIGSVIFFVTHPKKAGRSLVCTVLEYQVKQLRRRHHFKLITVAGSVGKTSTKTAIADLLSAHGRVRYQAGNYNDRVTVPLVFFGESEPSLFDVRAWLELFKRNARTIRSAYPYDYVVVELGTDGPGQMRFFTYLQAEIGVLTALTPEHMAFFKTMDAVAAEELELFRIAQQVLVNGDDTPAKYLTGRTFSEYSLTSAEADYSAKRSKASISGQELAVTGPHDMYQARLSLIGPQGAKFALAAGAVADMLKLDTSTTKQTLGKLHHFAGRMQVLKGIKQSTLIDDTYNASEVSMTAALDALYDIDAPQRIAIFGYINELGNDGPAAHQAVGEYCDPTKLDLVVTIGNDAKEFLAPFARAAGCTVHSFLSPYDAGEFVKTHLKKAAAVLAKGSQNRVFAEEALKPLLAKPADASKLVRQSDSWLQTKTAQFKR